LRITLIHLIRVRLAIARTGLYAIFTEAQQIFIPLLCRQSYIADMQATDLVGPAGAGSTNRRIRSSCMNYAESPHTLMRIMNLKNCLPAAWHRSKSAHSTARQRELGGRPAEPPVMPVSGRRLHSHRVALRLAIEESDILKARKEILCACGKAVEVLQCTRIRGTSRVRLRVTLEDGATAQTLQCVMQCLAAGEFGRVVLV
jgi:hypothetical protein